MGDNTKHAKCSASGSSRWLACTPSVVLEHHEPESYSPYAMEGTIAHAMGENNLLLYAGEITQRTHTARTNKIRKHELFQEEMIDYAQAYSDFVIERLNSAREKTEDAILQIESRLDFSKYVPEGFGTGDSVIISDGTVEIIDLKYGKGVQVDAYENPQMMLYGIGAFEGFRDLYKIENVMMTVYQPRLDHVSSYALSVEELEKWAGEYVKPRAELAIKGEGDFVPGEHCRFCRVKHKCRARAENNLVLAQHEFKKPGLLEDYEINEILLKADDLKKWVEDVKEYAFEKALGGYKWESFKLVAGRSVRKYGDDKAVKQKLVELGYSEAEICDIKLKGIGAMEKLLGKNEFTETLGDLIVKPEGKPTLVEKSDKRPEINNAEDDFDVII